MGFGREGTVIATVNAAQNRQGHASSAGLSVRLLGPLEFAGAGGVIALPSRKVRALLGYLAIRQGAAVDRGILAELLWGERSEDQARASLRQALSELRATAAGAAIVATRETVCWVEGSASIDARMVETAAASKHPDAMRAAAPLFRGELMEGLAVGEAGFERWLAAERMRFRLLAAAIHEALMREAEARGRIDEALEHGLRLLVLDPLQESVHRHLMQLHAAQGRHDAALAVYERCRRALSDELGVAPDAETEALARAVRARRRLGNPRPSPAAPARNAAGAGAAAVAVLPFATTGAGDEEEAYLGEGFAEDIITELSRYQSLRVIARSSSFRFRGQDAGAVGAALGVRYLVGGSVRRSGERIRVSAHLVDAATGTEIWAERYERRNEDIFAVQDAVAGAVVATVEGRIAARGAEHTRRKPTGDWEAYDFLLRGRESNHHYRVAEGERFFARAAEIDPGYAQAHAWRAIMLGVTYLHDERPETLEAAFASAREALRLDDNDARCHHAMAYVALRRCEFDLAGHHHARALALNPNDPQTMAQRANWLMHVGRLEEALAALDASLERDPFPPTWHWDVRGYVLYHLRRYREAVLAFRSVGAEPFWIAGMLAAAHAQAGEPDAAAAELARYVAARPGATLRTVADRIVYADPRMRDHWLEGLARAGLPP